MTHVFALFSSQRGVGTTTLVYHLAHMSARMDVPTLAVVLDPQADLTSLCFGDDHLEALWSAGSVALHEVSERLFVAPGDPALAAREDTLADAWRRGGLRTTAAFHKSIRHMAAGIGAQVVFLDVGPNLGAITRAALLAADQVVFPLAADVRGLRGLAAAGPILRDWSRCWRDSAHAADLPAGSIAALGYVVLRQVGARDLLLARIPQAFAEAVHAEPGADCLATLRSYPSLLPLGRDAGKPMFDLRAADGALGSTARLVQICFKEYSALASMLLARAGVETYAK